MKENNGKAKNKDKKKELMNELIKKYEKGLSVVNFFNKYMKKVSYVLYIVVATLFLVTIFSTTNFSFLTLIMLIIALLIHVLSDYVFKLTPAFKKTIDMLKEYEKTE